MTRVDITHHLTKWQDQCLAVEAQCVQHRHRRAAVDGLLATTQQVKPHG